MSTDFKIFSFLLCRIVFGIFFILNVVLWSKGSSACISFTTLLALLALWFGISVPLTFVGAFLGFRKRVRFLFIWLLESCNILTVFDGLAYWASGENQPNPSPSSRSKYLHPSNARNCYGRRVTLWMYLHPAVFHSKLNLVQSNVLHVWFLIPGLHYTRHHLLGNYYPALLFPPMCWGDWVWVW